jgi:hypothetical protein
MKWRFGTSHGEKFSAPMRPARAPASGIPSTFDNTPKSVTPGDDSSLDGRRSSLAMQIAYRFIEGALVSLRTAGRLFRRGRCAGPDSEFPVVGKRTPLKVVGQPLAKSVNRRVRR